MATVQSTSRGRNVAFTSSSLQSESFNPDEYKYKLGQSVWCKWNERYYESRIIDIWYKDKEEDNQYYFVHFKKFPKRTDSGVPESTLLEMNDANNKYVITSNRRQWQQIKLAKKREKEKQDLVAEMKKPLHLQRQLFVTLYLTPFTNEGRIFGDEIHQKLLKKEENDKTVERKRKCPMKERKVKKIKQDIDKKENIQSPCKWKEVEKNKDLEHGEILPSNINSCGSKQNVVKTTKTKTVGNNKRKINNTENNISDDGLVKEDQLYGKSKKSDLNNIDLDFDEEDVIVNKYKTGLLTNDSNISTKNDPARTSVLPTQSSNNKSIENTSDVTKDCLDQEITTSEQLKLNNDQNNFINAEDDSDVFKNHHNEEATISGEQLIDVNVKSINTEDCLVVDKSSHEVHNTANNKNNYLLATEETYLENNLGDESKSANENNHNNVEVTTSKPDKQLKLNSQQESYVNAKDCSIVDESNCFIQEITTSEQLMLNNDQNNLINAEDDIQSRDVHNMISSESNLPGTSLLSITDESHSETNIDNGHSMDENDNFKENAITSNDAEDQNDIYDNQNSTMMYSPISEDLNYESNGISNSKECNLSETGNSNVTNESFSGLNYVQSTTDVFINDFNEAVSTSNSEDQLISNNKEVFMNSMKNSVSAMSSCQLNFTSNSMYCYNASNTTNGTEIMEESHSVERHSSNGKNSYFEEEVTTSQSEHLTQEHSQNCINSMDGSIDPVSENNRCIFHCMFSTIYGSQPYVIDTLTIEHGQDSENTVDDNEVLAMNETSSSGSNTNSSVTLALLRSAIESYNDQQIHGPNSTSIKFENVDQNNDIGYKVNCSPTLKVLNSPRNDLSRSVKWVITTRKLSNIDGSLNNIVNGNKEGEKSNVSLKIENIVSEQPNTVAENNLNGQSQPGTSFNDNCLISESNNPTIESMSNLLRKTDSENQTNDNKDDHNEEKENAFSSSSVIAASNNIEQITNVQKGSSSSDNFITNKNIDGERASSSSLSVTNTNNQSYDNGCEMTDDGSSSSDNFITNKNIDGERASSSSLSVTNSDNQSYDNGCEITDDGHNGEKVNEFSSSSIIAVSSNIVQKTNKQKGSSSSDNFITNKNIDGERASSSSLSVTNSNNQSYDNGCEMTDDVVPLDDHNGEKVNEFSSSSIIAVSSNIVQKTNKQKGSSSTDNFITNKNIDHHQERVSSSSFQVTNTDNQPYDNVCEITEDDHNGKKENEFSLSPIVTASSNNEQKSFSFNNYCLTDKNINCERTSSFSFDVTNTEKQTYDTECEVTDDDQNSKEEKPFSSSSIIAAPFNNEQKSDNHKAPSLIDNCLIIKNNNFNTERSISFSATNAEKEKYDDNGVKESELSSSTIIVPQISDPLINDNYLAKKNYDCERINSTSLEATNTEKQTYSNQNKNKEKALISSSSKIIVTPSHKSKDLKEDDYVKTTIKESRPESKSLLSKNKKINSRENDSSKGEDNLRKSKAHKKHKKKKSKDLDVSHTKGDVPVCNYRPKDDDRHVKKAKASLSTTEKSKKKINHSNDNDHAQKVKSSSLPSKLKFGLVKKKLDQISKSVHVKMVKKPKPCSIINLQEIDIFSKLDDNITDDKKGPKGVHIKKAKNHRKQESMKPVSTKICSKKDVVVIRDKPNHVTNNDSNLNEKKNFTEAVDSSSSVISIVNEKKINNSKDKIESNLNEKNNFTEAADSSSSTISIVNEKKKKIKDKIESNLKEKNEDTEIIESSALAISIVNEKKINNIKDKIESNLKEKNDEAEIIGSSLSAISLVDKKKIIGTTSKTLNEDDVLKMNENETQENEIQETQDDETQKNKTEETLGNRMQVTQENETPEAQNNRTLLVPLNKIHNETPKDIDDNLYPEKDVSDCQPIIKPNNHPTPNENWSCESASSSTHRIESKSNNHRTPNENWSCESASSSTHRIESDDDGQTTDDDDQYVKTRKVAKKKPKLYDEDREIFKQFGGDKTYSRAAKVKANEAISQMRKPPGKEKRNDGGKRSKNGKKKDEDEEGTLTLADHNLMIPLYVKQILTEDKHLTEDDRFMYILPAKKSVSEILNDYASNPEVCQETLSHILHAFNRMLESWVLYPLERLKYSDMVKKYPNKKMSEVYGLPHLLRFIMILPKLFHMWGDIQHDFIPNVIKFVQGLLDYLVNQDIRITPDDYDCAMPDYYRQSYLTNNPKQQ